VTPNRQRARRGTGARAVLAALVVPAILTGVTAAPQRARPASSAGAAQASHAVEIRDFTYEPAELRVAVGDTVVFTNRDAFLHTVTDDDRSWDSAAIGPKRSWRLVVTGPASFHCAFHPSMRGELIPR
jgi:plastocyanin